MTIGYLRAQVSRVTKTPTELLRLKFKDVVLEPEDDNQTLYQKRIDGRMRRVEFEIVNSSNQTAKTKKKIYDPFMAENTDIPIEQSRAMLAASFD